MKQDTLKQENEQIEKSIVYLRKSINLLRALNLSGPVIGIEHELNKLMDIHADNERQISIENNKLGLY